MRRRSDNALVFMAKWPEPGRAKTRLSPPLSPGDAAELARCFLLDTLAEAAVADADAYLAFAPVRAADDFRRLVGLNVGLIPAEAPHLGAALREGQRVALAMGYRQVALVGSDLPHLPASRYGEAFAALESADAVIGPSADGGYYLLAAAHETPRLFENVTWSTAAVYSQTLERAAAAGLRLAVIDPCDDVDTADDLPVLLDALRRRPGAGHTLRMLERTAGQADGGSRNGAKAQRVSPRGVFAPLREAGS
jgi:rSAM/selenodomain-associated transferase 1